MSFMCSNVLTIFLHVEYGSSFSRTQILLVEKHDYPKIEIYTLLSSTEHTFCRRVISLRSLHLCAPHPSWNNALQASQTKLLLKAREFSLSLTLRSSSCFVSRTKEQGGFPLVFISLGVTL